MKTTLTIILSAIFFNVAVGQNITERKVPQNIKEAFIKAYGVTKIKWSKEANNYEASFEKDDKDLSVIFNNEGDILEKEIEIQKSDLPKFVTDFLEKNYTGFKQNEMAKIESSKGVTFEVEVAKGKESFELIFDAQSLIKKKSIDQD